MFKRGIDVHILSFNLCLSKSANINKKFEKLETKYEYFNTPSKHFVGSRNTFLFVFVSIWHFNSISSHLEDAPAAIDLFYTFS
jgi:hypothetical protein